LGLNTTKKYLTAKLEKSCMSVAQEALKQGDFLGAETIDVLPDWFKTTFMDFSEDLEEAHAKGRHVMIYL
jgi:hypothetical protein